MPNQWSNASALKRSTCDARLHRVFNKVLVIRDCTWVCGARSEAAQNEAFRIGNSQKQWPDSKHNCPDGRPSLAADVAPYIHGVGIPWKDREQFVFFAGIVIAVAHAESIMLRWGGDWDRDMDLRDQKFMDLAHWEIIE